MTTENSFLKSAFKSWFTFGGHVLLSVLILGSSILAAVVIGTGRSPDRSKPLEEIIPSVKTEIARRETNGITFQVDGVVIPFREVSIASEVSGNIKFLSPHCRTGRYVQKGEILAQIDSQDYEHALSEAQQSLIQADRAIEEWKISVQNIADRVEVAVAQFNTQKNELERCRKLNEKGAVSQTELETAELNHLNKKETLVTLQNEQRTLAAQEERLKSARETARVAVEKAELNLRRCTISSPLTGLVVTLNVEQDKFVQRGETLVSIHDTSRLEVQCSLYMKQVEWLWSEKPGAETPEVPAVTEDNLQTVKTENQIAAEAEAQAKAESAALRQYYQFDDTPVKLTYNLDGVIYQWGGTLTYLDGPGLDSRTRMMPCRVLVEDPLKVESFNDAGVPVKTSISPTLMPGMFVTIEIHANPARTLLNLAETAVLPGGTVWKVVKNEDGKDVLARASKITTAHYESQTGRIIVYRRRGALEEGDQVVISPLASPVEGTFVHVLNSETESEEKE
ncbi:MAG: biotin/lipoyl-binding protein [Thermoguttaceae bacterium]|nr:biotin/lipoyl-binding protein [Thermoguttaceae bacterium]